MANLANTQVANQLETKTIAEYAQERGFIDVAVKVRTNVNNYPYVTFIDENNVAENIYFTTNTGADYKEGMPIDENFFDKLQFVFVTNANGESRVKLAKIGGERKSLASLLK